MAQQSNILIDFTKWIFKWLAIFVAGLVVLGLLLMGGMLTWEWWSYGRHKGLISVLTVNSATQKDTKILLESGKSPEQTCAGGPFPIFVGFVNKSSRTVEYIGIDVSARLPGRSTNILTYDSYVKMDQIVEPGSGFGQCWRFSVIDDYKNNPELSKAIYSGRISNVRFKDE